MLGWVRHNGIDVGVIATDHAVWLNEVDQAFAGRKALNLGARHLLCRAEDRRRLVDGEESVIVGTLTLVDDVAEALAVIPILLAIHLY